MIRMPATAVPWLYPFTEGEVWQSSRRARLHVTGYGPAGRHYRPLRVPEAGSPRADHSHPQRQPSGADALADIAPLEYPLDRLIGSSAQPGITPIAAHQLIGIDNLHVFPRRLHA